jgi:hypothetical protein
MKEYIHLIREPYSPTRSTLLIPEVYYKRYFCKSRWIKIGHWPLARYFSSLMNDPQLHYKLSFLERAYKWKKQYQEQGQRLVRVNFYPADRDWGRLSAISNATGYSRCYIFVYLLLIAMGEISLGYGGTPLYSSMDYRNYRVVCHIYVDASTRKLTRILQT